MTRWLLNFTIRVMIRINWLVTGLSSVTKMWDVVMPLKSRSRHLMPVIHMKKHLVPDTR
ncbi:hypothetical protein LINPERHAP2_LOCUS14046 [Linum perenne]